MAVLTTNSHLLHRDLYRREQTPANVSSSRSVSNVGCFCSFGRDDRVRGKAAWRRALKVDAFWQDTSRPTSVELEPITGTEHLDQILQEAKDRSQPILIEWMAAWCRKCIYLKPKLEKLAVEYLNKVKFYCVDVNNVPQALVKRANISKMPTMQVWKDGEMKEEVIGGHKAWIVLEEVKEMIQKHI